MSTASLQIYTEAEYRILPDTDHRALIVGGTTLADAVAAEFARRNVPIALVADDSFDASAVKAKITQQGGSCHLLNGLAGAELVNAASDVLGGLTDIVNLCLPNPNQDLSFVLGYADHLLARNIAAADLMANTGTGGAIINHCALPVMYAGGPLEDYMSSLRGAITGVVRSLARRYGRRAIRSIGVQTGLVDLPEVQAWTSDAVKSLDLPVKRWATAEECAKLIAFSALDASYITGQTLILDGGLTAGISGI